MSLNSDNNNR